MTERKSRTNGATRPRPKHPDLRKATPEALARAQPKGDWSPWLALIGVAP